MKKVLPLLRTGAQVVGVGAVGFGLLADVLVPGSSPGMGLYQWVIVLAGVTLIVAGMADRANLARLRAWADEDTDAMGACRIATFAVMAGFLAGLAETLVLGIDRFAYRGIVRVGPHLVWTAPLFNAAILLTFGMLLWLGGRFWRKLTTPTVVATVLFAICADTILHRLRFESRISTEAKWIVVIGIATVLARSIARPLASSRRLVRATAAVATVVVLLGVIAALHPSWYERRVYAALPEAAVSRPNLILIILDTVRAASLSLYGYERPTTPQLERFAAGGVVFEQAIAPSSWTLPSHGTMFTGQDLHMLKVDWFTPLDRRYPTLAERLSAAGYATAGFSANTGYVSAESGLARGFARFEDFVITPGEAVRSSMMLQRILQQFGIQRLVTDDDRGRRTAKDINRATLRWLDTRPTNRPFFAFLNYFDAHAPFYSAPPFDTLYGGPQAHRDLKWWGPDMTPAEVAEWRDAYDRSLAYLDAHLGQLVDALERRGYLDDTIVVVTSDHGELLGEHSFMGHATTLYRPVLEVPFVLRGPGVPQGVRVGARVGLRDLPVTLLDLVGLDAGPIPGRSIAERWHGKLDDEPVYSELGRGIRIPARYPNAQHDLWSIFEADHHYIASSSESEELYHLATDPDEERNLIEATEHAAELARLRELLQRHLGTAGDASAPRIGQREPGT